MLLAPRLKNIIVILGATLHEETRPTGGPLPCSLFIRIGIRVFNFGSIEVDHLFCFLRSHVCLHWLRRAGITTASSFRNLGIKKPAGNTLRPIV